MTLLLGDVLVLSSSKTATSSESGKARAAEIVVGDETGSIIMTAQNGDQTDAVLALGSAGHPFVVWNAYTELASGGMCLRLLVDTFFGSVTPLQSSDTGTDALIQVLPPPPLCLNTKNNLSKIRYERV